MRYKAYWITFAIIVVMTISLSLILLLTQNDLSYLSLFILTYSIGMFLLYMALPLTVFSIIIITIIKFRKNLKKVLMIYLIIGFVLYLLISSIFFNSGMKHYDYSINCLNLLEGKPHNLKFHDYSSCSAYEDAPNQNYVNYLTNIKEGGVKSLAIQFFFNYTLLVIPFWPALILYPIIFLFVPT